MPDNSTTENLRKQIAQIDPRLVCQPNMPMAICLQEASDLQQWLQPDVQKLVAAGLDKAVIDSLRT